MKIKTHSGAKKRIAVKGGKAYVGKAAKRHLLVNKSKGQKSIGKVLVTTARMKALRRLMPGQVQAVRNTRNKPEAV
jgi:ribosomal protein L35